MASPSKKTETVRARKRKNRGRARKNALANHGTTLSREELFKVQDG
jgi:hypothetical protein